VQGNKVTVQFSGAPAAVGGPKPQQRPAMSPGKPAPASAPTPAVPGEQKRVVSPPTNISSRQSPAESAAAQRRLHNQRVTESGRASAGNTNFQRSAAAARRARTWDKHWRGGPSRRAQPVPTERDHAGREGRRLQRDPRRQKYHQLGGEDKRQGGKSDCGP